MTLLRIANSLDQLHRMAVREETHATDWKEYSFSGDDFPTYLPINLTQPLEMTEEESVHYSVSPPEAVDEWLYTAPGGYGGTIRLGPQHRAFFVSVFHQLHCIRYFRSEHVAKQLDGSHLSHCFNIIRQWTLCHPDLTLEPGDFARKDYKTNRQGATHVCKDWNAVYDVVSENYIWWFKYRLEHNITTTAG